MAEAILTAQDVRELLDYDAETGIFTRRVRTSNRIRVGDRAGTLRPDGYLKITLRNKSYLAHRLAWLHVHGAWPSFEIDHINGARTDNRIANLRDVRPSTNQENMRRAHKKNSNGLLGVTYHKGRNRWQAQIKFDGKNRFIGFYPSAEEAHKAYLAAKRRHHEGCTI